MMNTDFSEPRKQSPAGILILFADTFQKLVRAIALPLIFLLFRWKEFNILYLITGVLVLIALLGAFAYFRYQKFTFFLDEDKQEFIINEGVFYRSSLSIQLSKIQQVSLNQSLIQQLIGVYSLDIDTAGSEKKEASIKAIDHGTATLLKQKLLNRTISTDLNPVRTEETDDNAIHPVLKLSTATLLKVGLTSNYGASIALLTGFLLGLIQLLRDYKDAFEIEENLFSLILNRGAVIFSASFLTFLVLMIVLGTNIARTFIKYFNFEINKQKRSLAINSGLFTKRNTLLTPNKVQLSAYSQNYFQKKFNLVNMKIKQASYQDADQSDNKKSAIEIPGCNEMERDVILKMILDQVPLKGNAFLPNYRFLLLQLMIWIVLPVIVFIFLLSFDYVNPAPDHFFLILPYALLTGFLLFTEFKHHRLYVDQNFIIKKSGIWDVEHAVFEAIKIQAITTSQFFWHKKANVGHLTLHTASGKIHFKYGNYPDIQKLVNYWMFKIQTSEKNWM